MPYLKRIIILCGSLLLILLLTACSGSSSADTPNTTGNTNTINVVTPQSTGQATAITTPTPVPSTSVNTPPATTKSTPGSGPIVILSPTSPPGGNPNSQLVTLPDRTLLIQNVSKQSGADAQSTGVSMTLMLTNTSTTSILNKATYYQLVGAEGDIFGFQSSASSSFFGSLAPHSSRSGTIVFQVPTAAIGPRGIQLFYRSEVAAETVFVLLHLS